MASMSNFPRAGAQNLNPAVTNIGITSSDTRYNFEKIFSGQVMTWFEERSVFLPLHQVQTIDHGRSASFAYVGRVGASYIAPGQALLSKDIRTAEQIISVDSKLASWVFINDMDELMNHFALQDRYARELSGGLVRKFDNTVAINCVLAARCTDSTAAATIGWNGTVTDPEDNTKQYGTILGNALMKTDAQTLIDNILKGAQRFEEKDNWSEAKNCVLRPAQFYMLVGDRTALNKDWGGSGNLAKAELPEIGNIQLVKSNHLPSTNITTADKFAGSTDTETDNSASTAVNGSYTGDFTNTAGVIFTPDAVGTVRLRGIKMEVEPSVRFQGTLMVASYVQGHGILNPRCAVELSADPAAAAN